MSNLMYNKSFKINNYFFLINKDLVSFGCITELKDILASKVQQRSDWYNHHQTTETVVNITNIQGLAAFKRVLRRQS